MCTTCPKINLLFLCELLKHLLLMKKREKDTDVISSKQKQKTWGVNQSGTKRFTDFFNWLFRLTASNLEMWLKKKKITRILNLTSAMHLKMLEDDKRLEKGCNAKKKLYTAHNMLAMCKNCFSKYRYCERLHENKLFNLNLSSSAFILTSNDPKNLQKTPDFSQRRCWNSQIVNGCDRQVRCEEQILKTPHKCCCLLFLD